MATKTPAKRTSTARRPPAKRAAAARRVRGRSWEARFASWLGRAVARAAKRRREHIRTRKDAAILRKTHEGCDKCKGMGMIYKRGKNGEFAGSRPCPATPKVQKVSKVHAHTKARFGVDKHSGLIGWRCPCKKGEKPRYRDAKTATAALRSHERKRHGGVSVGGSCYAQLPENVQPETPAKAPAKKAAAKKTTTRAQAPARRTA